MIKRICVILSSFIALFFVVACSSEIISVSEESVSLYANEMIEDDISESLSPFKGLEVIEQITFTQGNGIEIMAALVRHGEDSNPPHSIEIFYPELNEFQSLYLARTHGWSRECVPHNLRIIELRAEGEMDIVVRTRVPSHVLEFRNDSFDAVFFWAGQYYSTAPIRTSTAEFENVDRTIFSATIAVINEYFDYRIEVYDHALNLIQIIDTGNSPILGPRWISGLNFYDLNNDGYGDLWKSAYALNEEVGARGLIYQGYIWDNKDQEFVEVEFVGFDWLMYPEYQEGYVRNYIRNYANNHEETVQILRWEGNRLILISEEPIVYD